MYFIVWVVDNRNHHIDLVEVVLVVRVAEAYARRVVAEDTVDIPDLLVMEDNSEEDTADVHSVVHLAVDGDCKSTKFRIYFMVTRAYNSNFTYTKTSLG